MIKAPISSDTLKLVQARRSLEAEKAAEKARAKEAKKKAVEVPAKAPEAVAVEPTPTNKRYIAHQIDTPADLLLAHRPDLKLYKWQAETLFQLAGYTDINDLDLPKTRPTDKTPLYYNLVAANGSGKDQVVISSFAVWFCLSKVRSRCVITSSSYEQLKDQTYKYIKNICEEINVSYGRKVFEIVEFLITCNDTGSEIKCFVTDDPGKAEGRHPFDEPGAEMAVIINEAKSITDEMFQAFSRFTGYNYWLEISSPGKNSGHFFKRCTKAKYTFPDKLEIGEFYWRRVTAFDCPHLLGKHIEHLKDEHGEQSLIYRSQVLAEFTSLDEAAFIPSTLFENYPNNPPRTFGLPNRAGIDLSLGGDETVAYFFVHGKLHLRTTKIRNEAILHNQIISWIKEFNITPSEVRIDDGGLGRPIVQRVQNAGYDVVPVRNEARSTNPNFYKNRGVENWNRLKRAIEDRAFPTVNDDLTRQQLCTRGFSVKGIVTYLEPKAEMRSRGLSSPDRADALALCFDGVPLAVFKEEVLHTTEPESRFAELLEKNKKGPLSFDEKTELTLLWGQMTHRPAQETLNSAEPREQLRGQYHKFVTSK
jgi:phage terminase large subunit